MVEGDRRHLISTSSHTYRHEHARACVCVRVHTHEGEREGQSKGGTKDATERGDGAREQLEHSPQKKSGEHRLRCVPLNGSTENRAVKCFTFKLLF